MCIDVLYNRLAESCAVIPLRLCVITLTLFMNGFLQRMEDGKLKSRYYNN